MVYIILRIRQLAEYLNYKNERFNNDEAKKLSKQMKRQESCLIDVDVNWMFSL